LQERPSLLSRFALLIAVLQQAEEARRRVLLRRSARACA
jgi:hypothetical protein